jgi:hypothetical protein
MSTIDRTITSLRDVPLRWIALEGVEFAVLVLGEPDDAGAPVAVIVRAPGAATGSALPPRHHHGTTSATLVLEGSIQIDGRDNQRGAMRVVPPGTVYGEAVGPEGCTFLELFSDRTGVVPHYVDDDGQELAVGGDLMDLLRSIAAAG